jgi:hypothetical protein
MKGYWQGESLVQTMNTSVYMLTKFPADTAPSNFYQMTLCNACCTHA